MVAIIGANQLPIVECVLQATAEKKRAQILSASGSLLRIEKLTTSQQIVLGHEETTIEDSVTHVATRTGIAIKDTTFVRGSKQSAKNYRPTTPTTDSTITVELQPSSSSFFSRGAPKRMNGDAIELLLLQKDENPMPIFGRTGPDTPS